MGLPGCSLPWPWPVLGSVRGLAVSSQGTWGSCSLSEPQSGGGVGARDGRGCVCVLYFFSSRELYLCGQLCFRERRVSEVTGRVEWGLPLPQERGPSKVLFLLRYSTQVPGLASPLIAWLTPFSAKARAIVNIFISPQPDGHSTLEAARPPHLALIPASHLPTPPQQPLHLRPELCRREPGPCWEAQDLALPGEPRGRGPQPAAAQSPTLGLTP